MSEQMALSAGYVPGDWLTVIGEHVHVYLPGEHRELALEVWQLVDDGARVDAVLDALLAGGLSRLDSFAVVETGASLRLLLRGQVRSQVRYASGEVRWLTPTQGLTWAEHVVRDAVSVWTEFSDAAFTPAAQALQTPSVEHRVVAGLVRASGVQYPAADWGAATPQAALVAGEPVPVEPLPAEPIAAVPSPAAPTPVVPPAPQVPVAPVVPAGSTPEAITEVLASPNGAAARLLSPSEPTAQPRLAAQFSTGDVVAMDRVMVIGRAPDANRAGPDDDPLLVTVPSPNHEISANHLLLRISAADSAAAVVTDLGSTNGSVLAMPGAAAQPLQPGVGTVAGAGAVIDLGDGLSITLVPC